MTKLVAKKDTFLYNYINSRGVPVGLPVFEKGKEYEVKKNTFHEELGNRRYNILNSKGGLMDVVTVEKANGIFGKKEVFIAIMSGKI